MNVENYRAAARRWWRQEIRPLLILALVMCSLRSSLADWNDVPTGSMKPTILEGDRVFVNKLAYDLKVPFTTWHITEWSNPQRGDIVVFFSPQDGTRLVKRVIGLPGDTVYIDAGQVYVNGRLLTESYVPEDYRDRVSWEEHRIPPGEYFVLGDHRSSSSDSRTWGFVKREKIYGKAVFVYWPLKNIGRLR